MVVGKVAHREREREKSCTSIISSIFFIASICFVRWVGVNPCMIGEGRRRKGDLIHGRLGFADLGAETRVKSLYYREKERLCLQLIDIMSMLGISK